MSLGIYRFLGVLYLIWNKKVPVLGCGGSIKRHFRYIEKFMVPIPKKLLDFRHRKEVFLYIPNLLSKGCFMEYKLGETSDF